MPSRRFTPDVARTAREVIEEAFGAQCAHGLQTSSMPSGMAGCGQFLDRPKRNQRGLHGTAAAIRVLACASAPGAQEIVPALVSYLSDRLTGEVTAGVDETFAQANIARDLVHTVKTAEVLYALSFVGAGVTDTRTLVTEYAEGLIAGTQDGGWGYFLGGDESFALLPTAHATRALARHGYSIDPYLPKLRAAATREQSDNSPQYVQIFALMVLAELGDLRRAEHRAFRRLWDQHGEDLEKPREARVNLPRLVGPHAYVGVPWQLYLMKLALLRRASATGPASAALTRLYGIANGMDSHGLFRYPDSGEEVSTRTNGILYDVLSEAEIATGDSSVIAALRSVRDSFGDVFRRRRVRRAIEAASVATIAGLILASVFIGVGGGIAASIVAALLISLVVWSRRNPS